MKNAFGHVLCCFRSCCNVFNFRSTFILRYLAFSFEGQKLASVQNKIFMLQETRDLNLFFTKYQIRIVPVNLSLEFVIKKFAKFSENRKQFQHLYIVNKVRGLQLDLYLDTCLFNNIVKIKISWEKRFAIDKFSLLSISFC